MAEIKKFPTGKQAQRRRWQASSGARGAPGPSSPRGPQPGGGRRPNAAQIIFLIALCLLAVFALVQSPRVRERPPADAMASYDFRTCKEARAVGAAPLMRGEQWYRSYLDEDGDGVACEVHPKAFLDDLFG